MSRFYGSMQGNRGEATRQGTAKSGIGAHIRGWDVGIRVTCYVNKEGKDECTVYLTGGTNGVYPDRLIGIFSEEELCIETNLLSSILVMDCFSTTT